MDNSGSGLDGGGGFDIGRVFTDTAISTPFVWRSGGVCIGETVSDVMAGVEITASVKMWAMNETLRE